jgi:hypothetical protein
LEKVSTPLASAGLTLRDTGSEADICFKALILIQQNGADGTVYC